MLDLSNLVHLANGAEVVLQSSMDRFYEAFKQYGLRKEVFQTKEGEKESIYRGVLA